MKTLILFIFFTALNTSADGPPSTKLRRSMEDKVFICVGGSGYAYHKTRKCTWLQNCTHTIKEVTLSEAKNDYKKRPCKPCYGQ